MTPIVIIHLSAIAQQTSQPPPTNVETNRIQVDSSHENLFKTIAG